MYEQLNETLMHYRKLFFYVLKRYLTRVRADVEEVRNYISYARLLVKIIEIA